MRVTQSMYYDNVFASNNSKLNKDLFDVNKQIASGLKIQYASDDVTTYSETMRLDNEVVTLGQTKKSTESGYKVSEQTDTAINSFTTDLNRTKTLLIQASNDSNDDNSRDAIARELEGIEKNLKSVANTSINGKFLFSGSAVNVKPIADDGTYQGNDTNLKAFSGADNKQKYNITGKEFFLGEDSGVKKEITSNVVNTNLLQNREDLQNTKSDADDLTSASSIRNLMGDSDDKDDSKAKHYFYLRGTKSSGESIKEKFVMKDKDDVASLLSKIGTAYGNTGSNKVVNVTMNSSGQIIVADKLKGSSKLDFHMVGAVDYNDDDDDNSKADVTDIDDLDTNGGTTDFDDASKNNGVYIKEFVRSNLTSASGATSIQGVVYDRTEFTKNGATLSSSTSQIVKGTNAFATDSTKLSEVADLSQGTAGTLDGTTFKLSGKNINGDNINTDIKLKSTANGGSVFTVGLTDYTIYNMENPRTATDADKVTHKQLMDVVNMVMTNNLPATNSADDYDRAIKKSEDSGDTFLSYDGKIQFKDLTSNSTKATLALYDSNSDDFNTNAAASVMTFNTNDSLTVRDSKKDFFKTIDDAIKAVKSHNNHPDADATDVRNVGIENAIAKIDDLQSHTAKIQSIAGAQSNTLSRSLERTKLLETSTISLRSSVIDTDVAESSLKLSQLTLNYKALLSTVSKVSKLSLVNYM